MVCYLLSLIIAYNNQNIINFVNVSTPNSLELKFALACCSIEVESIFKCSQIKTLFHCSWLKTN